MTVCEVRLMNINRVPTDLEGQRTEGDQGKVGEFFCLSGKMTSVLLS